MTFKGATYETMLEIERLIIVQKAMLRAYELELKYRRLQREKEEVEAVLVKVNLQENFIKELDNLSNDLHDKMNLVLEDLNEIEGRVFLMKFVLGKSNEEIMDKLALSERTLYRYFDSIDKELKETKFGNDIAISLSK